MRLKQRIEDFRVRELLLTAPSTERQHYRVYRVTKKKLTSIEAARYLAQEVGVTPADVSMAGLKDRQGVTIQHMAVHHGPPVSIKQPDLRIETVGYCPEALTPAASAGNSFEVVVRGLDSEQLTELRANMPLVRDAGVINYFDDQRFGNLRHGQGWIALDLMRGEPERALRALLTSSSFGDDPRRRAFKRAMAANWGDWRECRDVAGRFGEHHSLFEHLKREPEDFAGAFQHIATRLRLIHLYAFQSHMWNRAVADLVRSKTPVDKRVVVKSLEGPLVFPETTADFSEHASFRLPGAGLEDVENEEQRALLQDALAAERLVPAAFDIQGIPGFGLKGEDRPLIVRPQHMRVRPAEYDSLNQGLRMVRVRFELPRGAYATLVVRRLLGRRIEGGAYQQDRALEMSQRRSMGNERPQRGDRHEPSDRPDRQRHSGRHDGGRGYGAGDRGGQRSFADRGRGGYGDRGRGGRDVRDDNRQGRWEDPAARSPIQPSARAGAWRPGHGLSGDEVKDRDRGQGSGGRDDRRPRREFGDDRGRSSGPGGYGGGHGGGFRSSGPRDDRRGDRRDEYRGGRPTGGDRGGDRGGRPFGGRPNREGVDRNSQRGSGGRPWESDPKLADPGGSASDDSNWGAREDARNAQEGSSPRGSHGGGGGRPFGRRPEGGGDQRRPYQRPDRSSDRGSDGGSDRGGSRGYGGGRGYGSQGRPEGGRGRSGPDRGGRSERPSYGGSQDRSQGGRSEWRPAPRGGDRPRYDRSSGGDRPRHDRGPGGGRPGQDRGSSGWGGGKPRQDRGSSSSWGGDRSRTDRGSSERGGGGARPPSKPGGWGADRARHEHKPRRQDERPARDDRKTKPEQERNKDA